LFTRIEGRPTKASTAPSSASGAVGSDRSASIGTAPISASLAVAPGCTLHATSTPRAASARHTARPIPRGSSAPVTRATAPLIRGGGP
jgi:hypothetical protein